MGANCVLGVSDERGWAAVLQKAVSEVIQMRQSQLHQRHSMKKSAQLVAVGVIPLVRYLKLLRKEGTDPLLVAATEALNVTPTYVGAKILRPISKSTCD